MNRREQTKELLGKAKQLNQESKDRENRLNQHEFGLEMRKDELNERRQWLSKDMKREAKFRRVNRFWTFLLGVGTAGNVAIWWMV